MPTLKSDQQKLKVTAQRAERQRDQAQALQDYEAEKRAVHANMLRLRALRLAKEHADTADDNSSTLSNRAHQRMSIVGSGRAS